MLENDSSQANKIERVFSFEDIYKPVNKLRNFESSNSLDKLGNLDLIETSSVDDSKASKKKDKPYYMYEKKLTTNSKQKLAIRLILIILILIFIPFQNIVSNSLTLVEKNYLFNHIQNLVSFETLSNDSPKNIFNIFKFLLNKDFISGISCVLYILLHPYIALKMIYAVCIFFYVISISKCFYQSYRPLWEEDIIGNSGNDIIECETSFSNPSGSIFILHFYFLYCIFCIKEFYKQNKRLKIITKIILFMIYLGIIIFGYIFSLVYKLHYLHEIVFTNVITMILVCLLIELDKKIQRKFFNSTKTIFKTRKNKIKAFIFCFGLMFLAVLLYNFITLKSSLFSVENRLAMNNSCSQKQKEEIGLKSTFNDIPYIFCMMGAFWGVCLTIENNPGEWWYQPLIINENELSKFKGGILNIIEEKINATEILLLVLKSIFIIIVFISIWFGFYKIPYISFEFNFFVLCLKYFIINFICTGIMPIIFGFFKMNKKVEDINVITINEELMYGYTDENKKKKRKNIFATTLLVNYHEKSRYPFLHLKVEKNKEKENGVIYSFSEHD